jgi:hypothetical protein
MPPRIEDDKVETENNPCNEDKGAGIDLEMMVEERDTYQSLVRKSGKSFPLTRRSLHCLFCCAHQR